MLLTDLANNKKIEVEGGLYIISTPIGNRFDITLRAIYILDKSSVLICEDTRTTKKLFKLLNLNTKDKTWIPYNDHNASSKIDYILKELGKNKVASLVSEAGTPLISDPGYKLLQEAMRNKINLVPVPGASAITAALTISGAKTDNFCYLGFLSRNKYMETLHKYSLLKTTLVIFEAASRVQSLIKDIFTHFKKAKLVIVRELTKVHEEVIRIDITDFEKYIKNDFKFKGEITIILELNNYKNEMVFSDSYLLKQLKKFKPSQVAAMLAKSSKQNREEIYKRCVGLVK